MKDRASAYPGRVKLTPVSGQTNVYDLERWDSPTEPGTPLNKANLLTDAVAEFLGLDSTAVPNDAFRTLRERQKVEMCFKSIETSGTWTVPQNLYGNKIFAVLVGGGGSGGTSTATSGSTSVGGAGGSGHISFGNISVTPGQTLTAVIGAGGTAVTGTSKNGNSGGTTSFGGLSAAGGSGGTYRGASSNSSKGGDGGAGGGSGENGSGGNGSFGGGGGSYGYTGGSGGTYGGGGGSYNGTAGTGGTYGGNGGKYKSNEGTMPGTGASFVGSMEMWNLAAIYYGVDKFDNQCAINADSRTVSATTYGSGAGGGGLGSIGGNTSNGGGGGGFLSAGGSGNVNNARSGGGGLFGYKNNVSSSNFSGGGGFYAAGDSVTRGSGGKGRLGTTTAIDGTAGGSGVVAIWYFIYPHTYLNENI